MLNKIFLEGNNEEDSDIITETYSEKYQFCDPSVVDGTGKCSELPNHMDAWIDWADSNTAVRKHREDRLILNIYSKQDTSIGISYDTSAFNGECPNGNFGINEGLNTCGLKVDDESSLGALKITVGSKTLDVEITDSSDLLIITDSEKLFERYPAESNGVKAVLRQAYSNAEDVGIVYDLSQYDIGAANPFQKMLNYAEKIFKPSSTDNTYSLKVSNFIKEKCNGCKDVMVIGDDFVVPHYRNNITNMQSDWYFLWQNEHPESNYIYSDFPYYKTNRKSFADLKEIFEKDIYFLRYVPQYISIIKPKETTQEMENALQDLKIVVEAKFKHQAIIENSENYGCNSFDELSHGPLIIVGDESNNNLLRCYPFLAKDVDNFMTIERNQWSSTAYAVILNTDNPNLVNGFSDMIKSDSYSYYQDTFLVGIESTFEACSWVIYPGFDIIGDVCQGITDCAFDQSIGWCGASAALIFIPFGSSKLAHIGKWLADLGGEGIKFIRKFKKIDDAIYAATDLYKLSLSKGNEFTRRTLELVNKVPAEASKKLVDAMSSILGHYGEGHDVVKALDNVADVKGIGRLVEPLGKTLKSGGDVKGYEFQFIQTSKAKNLGEELVEIEYPSSVKLPDGKPWRADLLSKKGDQIIGTEMKSGNLGEKALNDLNGQVDKLWDLKRKGEITNGRIITEITIPDDKLRKKIKEDYGFELIEGGLN